MGCEGEGGGEVSNPADAIESCARYLTVMAKGIREAARARPRLHVVTVAWAEGATLDEATVSARMPADRNDAEFAANVLAKVARLVPSDAPDELARCRRALVKFTKEVVYCRGSYEWCIRSAGNPKQFYMSRSEAIVAVWKAEGIEITPAEVEAILNGGES